MSALFDADELVGEVLGSVYADRRTGFGVVELEPDGVDEPARCAGPLSDLVEGQLVRLVGAWGSHERWGPTFEAAYYEQLLPTTATSVRAFLAAERFQEVDDEARERVVATFGDDAGAVIERDPGRLEAEAGLTAADAARLHEAWVSGRALAELVRLGEPAGVPLPALRAVHAHFGSGAVRVATDDPYALLEVDRVRFAHADALAARLGIGADDPRRLAAGVRAAVAAARRRDGHQVVPRRDAVAAAAELLEVDVVAASAGVAQAVARGMLGEDRIAPRSGGDAGLDVLAPPSALRRERALARDLVRLLDAPHPRLASFADEVVPSAELTDGQARAVHGVFASSVSILTGGPGTGKTRTVEEVVRAAEAARANVALCAPTGRAARRLEEMVGRPASTVHRLLEARPTPEGGFVFTRGADDRLPHDLVVCDEVSMCDTSLAAALVAAVDDGAHLLLVGDPHQLPSVGPGDVLADLLASGVVPVEELTEVHRQAAASRIVALAREIDAGAVGELPPVAGDVFVGEEPRRAAIVDRVVRAVAVNAPRHLGVDPADVQVVAPVYRGPVGVDALNAALKARLNPGEGQPEVAGFHAGDRVLQTRNDPDLDVSNGDIGTVVDVDVGAGRLRVGFGRGEVTYERRAAADLVPAWAVTVHKSQGGEWPVVVLVCDRSHGQMLWRRLLYTAATRAREALVVVGQGDALRRGAAGERDVHRWTGLAGRLRDEAAARS